MGERSDRVRQGGRTGPLLAGYLLASHAIGPLAGWHLRRRLRRGREDPARWREKLGEASAPRPKGRLVWLHAVGLGEVLALRGLIAAMARQGARPGRPGPSFLVTSTARSSAAVMAANLPPRTQHQFLPLDAPEFLARFLDHWRPDLSVWAEQELWPGAVVAAHRRGVPLALVNARLTEAGYRRRARLAGLYRDLLGRFALIAAQEAETAARLRALAMGGNLVPVQVTGSLKSAAPPLAADPERLAAARAAVAGRRVWVAASTHPGDEAEALAAQRALFAGDPSWLLVLVPRDPARGDSVAAAVTRAGLGLVRRGAGQGMPPGTVSGAVPGTVPGTVPATGDSVWLVEGYGELGLWYRLADRALVGGGFDAIGGHNPWEAAALGAAVLHGPDTANFRADYAALDGAGAAVAVAPGALAAALQAPGLERVSAAAAEMVATASGALDPLAGALLGLMEGQG